MGFNRYAGALLASAAGMGISLGVTASFAADMPLKAPPPVVEPLDMHAFFDVSFKNAYITPRGLLVTNTGLTTQFLAGLAGDVYKSKTGFINSVSVYGYVWNDLWSEQRPTNHTVGSWNEFDWAVGMTVKFAQNWKFGVEYVEFLSPPGNFSIERNIEFTLAYDDSSWWGGGPFTLNPYVKLFYAVSSGSSTVVTGKAGDTYDVELGIVPDPRYEAISRHSIGVIRADLGHGWPLGLLERRRQSLRPCAVQHRQCWRFLDRSDRQVGAGLGACAIRQVVRQGRLPVLQLPQRQPAAGADGYAWRLRTRKTHKDYVVGFGGLGFSF